MPNDDLNIVTGSFSYTGKYLTRKLLAMGKTVKTLTGHPGRADIFDGKVEAMPFNFERPEALTESLKGASTLFNTYWVRFTHKGMGYHQGVENTKVLIKAAKEAGLKKFVHISITNPSEDSPFQYFSGKAIIEKELKQSGLSYAIIRPALIFGPEDILIHNIAWTLRRLPVFGVPGSGSYRVQPVFVEDLAELMVNAAQTHENQVIDAVGPEIYTFKEMVELIAEKMRRKVLVLPVAPVFAYLASKVISYIVNDVVLTWDEVHSLMADLLVSEKDPTGSTRLSEWLEENADRLGKNYASELDRHFR